MSTHQPLRAHCARSARTWPKAKNCLYMTFCLSSFIAMSLLWLPSGVAVTHTRSTGAQVGATVQTAPECGQFAASKYEVKREMQLMAKLFIWYWMVHGNTWCLLDVLGYFLVVIRWYLVVSGCLLVVSGGLLRFLGDRLRMRSSIQYAGAHAQPPSYTLQPLQDNPMWTLCRGNYPVGYTQSAHTMRAGCTHCANTPS